MPPPASRLETTIRLKASCNLVFDGAGCSPTVALLRPRSGEVQWACNERCRFDPSLHPSEYVDSFGNLCQRFVAPPGRPRLRADATVETDDLIVVYMHAPAAMVQALPDAVLQFLLQGRYCSTAWLRWPHRSPRAVRQAT